MTLLPPPHAVPAATPRSAERTNGSSERIGARSLGVHFVLNVGGLRLVCEMPMNYTKPDEASVLRLYLDGLSGRAVAARLGCNSAVVFSVIKQHGVSRDRMEASRRAAKLRPIRVARSGRKWARLRMEQHLGRKLDYNETVHHKDGNPLNNDLANLEVLSRAEHGSLHSRARWAGHVRQPKGLSTPRTREQQRVRALRWRSRRVPVICRVCDTEFMRSVARRGLAFCGRSCAMLHHYAMKRQRSSSVDQ